MIREFFVCRCHSIDHQFAISSDEDSTYIEIRLNNLPWYQRIVVAIRYIFGVNQYSYEEVLLSKEETKRLYEVLHESVLQ